MFSVPVILLIVAVVVGAIGIAFAIASAVQSRRQNLSADASGDARWGVELGFVPDDEGAAEIIAQWEHGPAADGGLTTPMDAATGEFGGHLAVVFAQEDGWIVALQRDSASSVVAEIHPQQGGESAGAGHATDVQVYSSDVDAMIRATDDRMVDILNNHPADVAMAWFEGCWSAVLMPLDGVTSEGAAGVDGVDVAELEEIPAGSAESDESVASASAESEADSAEGDESADGIVAADPTDPDSVLNAKLPRVLAWLSNLNDALRVLPPVEGEEEDLSLQGVGPTRPLAYRTDADSLPVDADSFEPEEAGFVSSGSGLSGEPLPPAGDYADDYGTFTTGSLADLPGLAEESTGLAGLRVVPDLPTESTADSDDTLAAEADSLAIYTEAEAVGAVDEFPGDTQVGSVPADDEWITPPAPADTDSGAALAYSDTDDADLVTPTTQDELAAIAEPERPADFIAPPVVGGFPSREVGVAAVPDTADTSAAAGLGGRSAVPPVGATAEDARPRLSFVKPAEGGSHAAREGELSTMQTGQFPIINPDMVSGRARHVRDDSSEDGDTPPSWFVPGKASRRSRRRDD